MTGSIRQRGTNSWQVRIYRGVGTDGKKLSDSFTVKGTREDAERFLRKKLYELDTGTYVPPSRVTFEQHAEEWLENHVRVHLRPTTAESYETLLRKHAIPALGARELAKLEPVDL